MKFSEAMEKLKSGSKVTRTGFNEGLYFMMIGDEVKSFQPILKPYIFDESIMISDGWQIIGQEGEHKFCDITFSLWHGAKAKLKHWSDSFIYVDKMESMIVVHTMEILPFIPNFLSFMSEDWIEII